MSALEGCYDLDSWLCLAGYEPLMDVTNESLPVRLLSMWLADGNDVSSTAEEFFIQIDKYLEQCQGLNENE